MRYFMLFLLLITSCASVAQEPLYSFSGLNGPPGSEFSGSVILRYKNTSSTSQCIYSKDLSEHPLRHALRVYDRTGKNIEYSGILADVNYSYASVTEVPEDYYSPNTYYILSPGVELISHFSVTENYQIKPNEKYTVRYTIPVTPCSAIANGLKEIPSAYQPFFVEPSFRLADNDSDWAQRLEIHTVAWPKWASVGFWAEMEPVEFRFEE